MHSAPRKLEVTLAEREVTVTTDTGLFSPGRIDPGTSVLLRHLPPPPANGALLDLGCGWGPLTLTAALLQPTLAVWALDVNERALAITDTNARRLGLLNVRAVAPTAIPEATRFDAIWSNPPIRIGKTALHTLLMTWLPRLAPGASAHIVVQRNLGADSLYTWLSKHFYSSAVERIGSAKGYRVLRITAPQG